MSAEERTAVAGRLHSVAIRLLRSVRGEDRASGLTPARLSALSVLVFGGPRTLGELAAAEQVTAPTMSRLVAALEEAGLVRRGPHPEDGRSVVLDATGEGRRLMEEGRDRRVARLAELLRRLDPGELEAAEAACGALESALESAGGDRRGGGDDSDGGGG